MPIEYMGDGINRVFYVAFVMLCKPDSLLLIDEIENGLHYSIQSKFWEMIMKLSDQNNVQVIATTHSYECIHSAADNVDASNKNLFSYLRLSRMGSEIVPKIFAAENLKLALSSELEMR